MAEMQIDIPREKLSLQMKLKIREAFGWECQYCGYVCPEDERAPHLAYEANVKHDYAKRQRLHIDRVIPRARGGTYHFRNITLACTSCNCIKGTSLFSGPVRTFADILEGADG